MSTRTASLAALLPPSCQPANSQHPPTIWGRHFSVLFLRSSSSFSISNYTSSIDNENEDDVIAALCCRQEIVF
jgi:hypothetical protein